MKTKLLALFLLFFCIKTFSNEKHTVSGYITDFETGEELIGVNISVNSAGLGTTSNSYGFYSLTLKEENYVLSFSLLGYSNYEIKLNFTNDTLINIKLERSVLILNEVTISGEKLKAVESNYKTISIQEIKMLPSVFGEHDIIKAIQIEPGVKNIGDGSSGLYIRGGNRDQN
ncbi:MAG: carboxypeptidase-like regulatory domain-containing protein, partial [Bacteroidales bacterium]|nr:carboxypeptidase-like regulatory domain-containing protein [Bacteroidales bacterium]